MTAVLLLLRAAGALLVAAAIAAGTWCAARALCGLLRRWADCYDVESMDEAEILARKYDKQAKKARGKRQR